MQLRNKHDGKIYRIETLDDEEFAIYVYAENSIHGIEKRYRTLAEFFDEWEDIDD